MTHKNLSLTMRTTFFLVVIILLSCNNINHPENNETVVVKDMLGREVVVPAEVNRVIGLRAGALRLLLYMDAADLIAGIEENEKQGSTLYMQIFSELKELPSLGPMMGGDAEMIMNAQPDVVFMSYTTVGDADALQEKTGIPVVALHLTDMGTTQDTLYESFRLIGKIISKEERAEHLIGYIQKQISELNQRTKDVQSDNNPSAFISGLSYSGSFGISSTHHEYAPFALLNANNVAASIDKKLVSHVKGTFIDIEQLLLWNPQFIFIDESGLELVMNDFISKPILRSSLNAVNQGNIYSVLPYNNYATNYESVVINAWYIGSVMFPDRFDDVDISVKSKELMSMFYNRKVYGSKHFVTGIEKINILKHNE